MPTINAGASATQLLIRGAWISTSGTGVAVLGPGPSRGQQYPIQNSSRVGPFEYDVTVYISAITTLTFDVQGQSLPIYTDEAEIRAAEKLAMARGALIRCTAWTANEVVVASETLPVVRRLPNDQMVMYTVSGTCGATAPTYSATGEITDGTARCWALGQVSRAAPSDVPIPTVTQTTGTTSLPVVASFATNPERFRRAVTPNIVVLGSDTVAWLYNNGGTNEPLGTGVGVGRMAYKRTEEFFCASQVVELTYFTTGSGFVERPRVWVDDYMLEEVPSPFSGAAGGTKRIVIDYTSTGAKWDRRYKIEVPAGVRIRAVSAQANETIRPVPEMGLWGSVNMDSYGSTVSTVLPTNINTNYAPSEQLCEQVMRDLGFRNVLNMHEGGTGYSVNGTNGRLNVRDLVFLNSVANFDVLYAIIALSGNDFGGGIAASVVRARALETWREKRRQNPRALIHVYGPFPSDEQSNTTLQAMDAALLDAFVEWNDPNSHYDSMLTGYSLAPGVGSWIDGPWVTGSGRVGATTGVGTSDIYTGTDSAHYSPPGKVMARARMTACAERALTVRTL